MCFSRFYADNYPSRLVGNLQYPSIKACNGIMSGKKPNRFYNMIQRGILSPNNENKIELQNYKPADYTK